MKEHYINIYPLMSDFLKIFDIPFENGFNTGDIAYHIEDYSGGEITAKELYEDMNIRIAEQDGHHFVVFKLAPFLGLANLDWKEELKELKSFLEWVKEEAINHPEHKVKLGFMRVGDKVDFNLISDNEELEKELNIKMDEKVANSPALTQWVANQKKGYREVEKQCYDLWISMDSFSLMSLEEQTKLLKARPVKKQNHFVKEKRKNRF